ncbi:MAG: RagB/SusD family nutrient uptake outer membrane protein, partial [Parabacteroides gordonii]|nr:RagB/SusD family nutrient uptake outer membrane protein [Parabacteroides gordonii]
LVSCTDLDLSPVGQGTNETWYSDEKEITLALNDLYRHDFWFSFNDQWTDDEIKRDNTNAFIVGTVTGQTGDVTSVWANQYKAIARANTILMNLDQLPDGIFTQEKKDQMRGESLFIRACRYSEMVSLFGDVPYVTEVIDIDEAFSIGRTPKTEIIASVYDDFDEATNLLPVSTNLIQRATKGAALAMKARFALYNSDWQEVVDATKAVMQLNCYKLYPSYEELFLQTTHNTTESIFSIPRSVVNNIGVIQGVWYTARNAGGWAGYVPSWDLLASYTCTDGLPIDESPLFDSHDPFKNRDPRCCMSIVPFNSEFLGFTYAPHPDSLEVFNPKTGVMQPNVDNRAVAQYASFNALLWKKGIDDTWLQNAGNVAPDRWVMRYADVLLMYAEAKIELNEIDESVLDAINQVRARAYGVDVSATSEYPAITETNQQKLRTILRMERRMELAKEGLRYMDLVRWRLLEKTMNQKNYGILYPADNLRDKVTSKGHWFWASVPAIDENGIPDFTEMEKAGLIQSLSQRSFNERQYLWPIPSKEILINGNIKQNPGY